MPLKNIWSALCSRTAVDSQTNNISLFDILEQITVDLSREGFKTGSSTKLEDARKAVPYEYSLVTFWTKTQLGASVKATIKLEIYDPLNQKLKEETFDIVVPELNKRVRHITRFKHLFITSSGIYNFRLSIKKDDQSDYQLVSEVPLEVSFNLLDRFDPVNSQA